MEPVLFYGVPHGCSFGSIVALEWLNQPYRLCQIQIPVDPKGDAYELFGRVNPVRETPALLLEDGSVLNESLAILHNIAARDLDGKIGVRQGTREFDQLNYVLGFLHTSFHPTWGAIFQPHKYVDDAKGQEVVKAKARTKAAAHYTRIDRMLEGRQYLIGDRPTVADAYLAGVARWGEDSGLFELKDYPRLHKLLQKLEADRGVIFAHAIEDGTAAATSGEFLGLVTLSEVAPRLAA